MQIILDILEKETIAAPLEPVEIEDFHVHIGQYENEYYDFEEVFDTVFSRPEILGFYYSSTTSCKEDVNYIEVEAEMDDAAQYRFPEGKYSTPLLWYKPDYIEQGVNPIKEVENCRYGGIKLHPFADNWDFEHNDSHRRVLHRIFESAGDSYEYIVIHTGESGRDSPRRFLPFFKDFPHAPVILAHGRPVREIIPLLSQFKNLLCDTAFMPEAAVRVISGVGLGHRILLGSDFPITHYLAKQGPYGENLVSLSSQYARDIEQMKKHQAIIKEMKITLESKEPYEY